MDYKGEEINEVAFLKKMIDELKARKENCYYLYNEGGAGINDEKLYKILEIDAKRYAIDKYSDFYYNHYKDYKEEEINDILEFNYKLTKLLRNKDIKDELRYTVVKCLENLKQIDTECKIDLFVFFGNSIFSNIIRAYCKKNKKAFFNMENGYFRPFTLMVDPQGVNYESSIPRDINFYKNIKVDEDRYNRYLKKAEFAYEEKKKTWLIRKKFYDYFGVKISNRIIKQSRNIESVNFINDEEYIYVPFQLETDSQIIKHSKHIKSMKRLVEITSEALNYYNKKNNSNLKMVYKVHPLYKSELNLIDINGIKAICDNNENLVFMTEGDNKSLVENAKVVITINSTVGFEALQLYKPVIVLGEAFYGIDGLTYVCKELDDLPNLIEEAISNKLNKEDIMKFVYYLRFEYFSEIYRAYPDSDSIKRLVDKLLGVKK